MKRFRLFLITTFNLNLTMFPTSDKKNTTHITIANILSYNILKFRREWSYNNRDTAQRTLSCSFMFWQKSPAVEILRRKYDILCIVVFNQIVRHDNVIKMKNKCHNFLSSYNISKSGSKSITGKRDNLNWTNTKMTSSMKNTFSL